LAPGLPGGRYRKERDFPIKDSVPIIQADKTLLSCDYRINSSKIVSVIINDVSV
jgi:hypothetical protein